MPADDHEFSPLPQAPQSTPHGKLKIFFGAAPGVGKTFTMLEAARTQAKDGVDVVIGVIDSHARPETQALVLGLDVLARRELTVGGTRRGEFDLEAAILRKPQLIVIDQLAHANSPGMAHGHRWQDVASLLKAGIHVYTTLDVEQLESLHDVVARIPGLSVREAVPDSVFESADEVELVDLSPDALMERLGETARGLVRDAAGAGTVYDKGTLIALRELALRKAAERVGAQMDDYREAHGHAGQWPAGERVLVCVGASPFSSRLVRATRRIAASIKAPWIAVHIETPAGARMSKTDRDQLAQTLHLAEQLGGETVTLTGHNLAEELIHYAHTRHVTKIIAGKPHRRHWQDWFVRSPVDELTRNCGDIDIYVISGDPDTPRAAASRPAVRAAQGRDYLAAVVVVLACSGVSELLSHWLAATNLVMVYLLGVVFIATRFGSAAAILAAVLSVLAFDFFFVPPTLTFAVQDTQYLLTFAVMLATGLTISRLTARVQFQAASARSRERRIAALYAVSHQLAAARTREQIAQAAMRHVADSVDAQVTLLLANDNGRLLSVSSETAGFAPSPHDQAVARWAFDHGEPAGHGTTTLAVADGLYVPLNTSHGTVGVLGILPHEPWGTTGPERLHLLEAFAGLIALAIERVQLAAEAARIRVQIETEQLRSSLLSAVSHDLRTPLAVITGGAGTLLEGGDSLDRSVRQELLESVLGEADHLNRLVANLLDMTRLEAGGLEVSKEWQSFEEIVGAAIARASQQLAEHPVLTNLAAELPFVPMDDLLIGQVLLNLIENAAKYSAPGTPIEISAAAHDGQLTVEIADRGRGLPPEDLDRVFEKFYRAGNAAGRPGAGLGLAICRGIIELHGGTIVAQNRPGGGAVFRFSLPLAATQPKLPLGEALLKA